MRTLALVMALLGLAVPVTTAAVAACLRFAGLERSMGAGERRILRIHAGAGAPAGAASDVPSTAAALHAEIPGHL